MWMPAQTTRPPLRTAFRAERHKIADGGENDGGVERGRRRFVRSARPDRAETSGEGLGRFVARPGEGEHRPALPESDLSQDVGGGAETIEAQAPALAGDDQGAPADQPGAEQRCERHVLAFLAQRKSEARVGDGRRGEAAVAGEAGEQRRVAEVFLAGRRSRGRRRQVWPSQGTPMRSPRAQAARHRGRAGRSGRRSHGRE